MSDFHIPEDFIGQTVDVFFAIPLSDGRGTLSFPSKRVILKESCAGSIRYVAEGKDTVLPKDRIQHISKAEGGLHAASAADVVALAGRKPA